MWRGWGEFPVHCRILSSIYQMPLISPSCDNQDMSPDIAIHSQGENLAWQGAAMEGLRKPVLLENSSHLRKYSGFGWFSQHSKRMCFGTSNAGFKLQVLGLIENVLSCRRGFKLSRGRPQKRAQPQRRMWRWLGWLFLAASSGRKLTLGCQGCVAPSRGSSQTAVLLACQVWLEILSIPGSGEFRECTMGL